MAVAHTISGGGILMVPTAGMPVLMLQERFRIRHPPKILLLGMMVVLTPIIFAIPAQERLSGWFDNPT